jgi:hypothetical protein
LVVVGADAVEAGVNDGLDCVKVVKNGLALVQIFTSFGALVET